MASVVQQNTGEAGLVTRRIAGETIVVPLSGHVGDLDSIYTFNEVGSRVWSLLESPTSVEAIAAILADEYDAPVERIAADVSELVDALRAKGLVRIGDAGGAPEKVSPGAGPTARESPPAERHRR